MNVSEASSSSGTHKRQGTGIEQEESGKPRKRRELHHSSKWDGWKYFVESNDETESAVCNVTVKECQKPGHCSEDGTPCGASIRAWVPRTNASGYHIDNNYAIRHLKNHDIVVLKVREQQEPILTTVPCPYCGVYLVMSSLTWDWKDDEEGRPICTKHFWTKNCKARGFYVQPHWHSRAFSSAIQGETQTSNMLEKILKIASGATTVYVVRNLSFESVEGLIYIGVTSKTLAERMIEHDSKGTFYGFDVVNYAPLRDGLTQEAAWLLEALLVLCCPPKKYQLRNRTGEYRHLVYGTDQNSDLPYHKQIEQLHQDAVHLLSVQWDTLKWKELKPHATETERQGRLKRGTVREAEDFRKVDLLNQNALLKERERELLEECAKWKKRAWTMRTLLTEQTGESPQCSQWSERSLSPDAI